MHVRIQQKGRLPALIEPSKKFSEFSEANRPLCVESVESSSVFPGTFEAHLGKGMCWQRAFGGEKSQSIAQLWSQHVHRLFLFSQISKQEEIRSLLTFQPAQIWFDCTGGLFRDVLCSFIIVPSLVMSRRFSTPASSSWLREAVQDRAVHLQLQSDHIRGCTLRFCSLWTPRPPFFPFVFALTFYQWCLPQHCLRTHANVLVTAAYSEPHSHCSVLRSSEIEQEWKKKSICINNCSLVVLSLSLCRCFTTSC